MNWSFWLWPWNCAWWWRRLWLIGNSTLCRSVLSVIVLTNWTPAWARPILLISHMITDRIELHPVVLPLSIRVKCYMRQTYRNYDCQFFDISIRVRDNDPFVFCFFCDIIFSQQKCDCIKAITQLCSSITSLWYKSWSRISQRQLWQKYTKSNFPSL